MHEDWWQQHLKQVGAFIKEQRRLAELSQREFARSVNLSDTYMSQLERGMHEPSIRVLRAIADGLNLSAEQLITFAAGIGGQPEPAGPATTEGAIKADPRLSVAQKQALLGVLRSYLTGTEPDLATVSAPSPAATTAAAAPAAASPANGTTSPA